MRTTRCCGLRVRISLLVCGAWIVFAAILWLVTTSFVSSGYDLIERGESSEIARRAKGILDARVQGVDLKAHDWAEWNDLDEWLRFGRSAFLEEDMSDSVMAIIRERDYGFFRSDRSVAAIFSFDPRTRAPIAVDTACIAQVIRGGRAEATGFHRCGDELAIFAARPVHHSQLPGSSGWFVVGHRVDSAELALLSGTLGQLLRIRLARPGEPIPPSSDSFSIVAFDVPVVGDSAVARVEIRAPRSAHLISEAAQRRLLVALGVLILLGSLLSLMAIEIFVVRRILRLSEAVVSRSPDSDDIRTTFSDGIGDEIGSLGAAIDGLVGRLHAVQVRLRESLVAAEAGMHAKGSFLASMSHDLRTPLNGMIGLTEFLAKTRLDPSQREAIDLLRGGSENLLTMINDILEFSRSEAGHVEILPEDVETESMLYHPVRILAPLAHRQGVDITMVVDPDLPSRIIVDSERMRQVLHNLVGNAVKFVDEGEVLVQVRRISQNGNVHRIRFSVCDTGPGIGEDVIGTIFEPFVQGSTDLAKRRGGAGLGLTIAHRIVERMGGELQVRSKLGGGCEFFFEIELAAPAGADRLVPLRFPWTGGAPVAVLVRRASLRAYVMDLLWWMGIESIELLVPESVHALSGADRIALIVSDIESLGETDLREFDTVRSHPAFADAPLVILSRTDLLDDAWIRQRNDVYAILRRPVPPSQFFDTLQGALRPRAVVRMRIANPFLGTMVSGMLERRGHEVASHDDVHAREARPDVILLDGESPGVDRELAEEQALHPGADAVLLGGASHLPGAERIDRPFSAESLLELVDEVMCRRRRRGFPA